MTNQEEEGDERIVPVILSGGSGTRLWPLSTPDRPKQLHSLTRGPTMLQMTVSRVADASRFTSPILVVGARHVQTALEQLAAIDVAAELTIVEPVARNTAAAIAVAALEAKPDAMLLVLPSDQLISRPDNLMEAVNAAAPLANQGYLVTFGIVPSRPDTGFGYIRKGLELGGGGWAVEQFVEKPDAKTAARFLATGNYYWNGGIFLFRASELLAGLLSHAPDIVKTARDAAAGARRQKGEMFPDPQLFEAIRSVSIDHALFERHSRVAVVPVDMEWSDVGSWDALYGVAEKDLTGNSATGPVWSLESRECLLHSSGPKLVTIGCENLIVVATHDAVLVLPRGQSQRVKEVAERLAAATPTNLDPARS